MGIRIFNHKGSIDMNFVGIKLKEDTPLEQGIEEGIILQLSNFALVNAREEAQVWVESEGDSYILVSLNSHHPQHAADVIFTDQEIKLFVKGKGEVHVTGTFAIDDSMMSGSEDELGDSDLMAEYPSSDDEDVDPGHPAYAGSRRIEMLEDESSSSSEPPVQVKKQKVSQQPQQQQQQQKKQKQPQQQQQQQQQQQKQGNNNNKKKNRKNKNKGGKQ